MPMRSFCFHQPSFTAGMERFRWFLDVCDHTSRFHCNANPGPALSGGAGAPMIYAPYQDVKQLPQVPGEGLLKSTYGSVFEQHEYNRKAGAETSYFGTHAVTIYEHSTQKMC